MAAECTSPDCAQLTGAVAQVRATAVMMGSNSYIPGSPFCINAPPSRRFARVQNGRPATRVTDPVRGACGHLKQLLIGELPLSSLGQLNANRLGSGVRGANNVNAARYTVHSSSLGLVCIGSQSGKGLDAGPSEARIRPDRTGPRSSWASPQPSGLPAG